MALTLDLDVVVGYPEVVVDAKEGSKASPAPWSVERRIIQVVRASEMQTERVSIDGVPWQVKCGCRQARENLWEVALCA